MWQSGTMEQNDNVSQIPSHYVTCYTSTAYSLYRDDWTAEKNKSTYGSYASKEGLGCNFQLDAKCTGRMSAEQKQAWKQKVKQISLLIDHKHLNQDLAYFSEHPPTLENIVSYLFQQFEAPKENNVSLRLWEGPYQWVEISSQTLVYGRSARISCVHKHWNPELNAIENKNLYGKCSGLHGHEYRIEVSLSGDLNKESGWIASRDFVAATLKQQIVDKFNGQFLNDHLGNTSGEKIALQINDILKKAFLTHQLHRLSVYETRKNSFFAGASPF